jgi:hypothetical protein
MLNEPDASPSTDPGPAGVVTAPPTPGLNPQKTLIVKVWPVCEMTGGSAVIE